MSHCWGLRKRIHGAGGDKNIIKTIEKRDSEVTSIVPCLGICTHTCRCKEPTGYPIRFEYFGFVHFVGFETTCPAPPWWL